MTEIVDFVFLGLAAGALYAVWGVGCVAVFRATGIINFAIGTMATWGAYVFAGLKSDGDLVLPIGRVHFGAPLPAGVSLVVGAGSTVVIALIVQVVVFRPLRRASVLAQVIASVGLMLTLQALMVLRFGALSVTPAQILPVTDLHIGALAIGASNIYLAVLAVVVAGGFWAYFRYARIGLATTAVAADAFHARLMGFSPERLAALVWIGVGATTSVVTILAAPTIGGLDPTDYPLYIVPALAVALLGGLTSVWATCASGLALGAFQSLITLGSSQTWWPAWAQSGIEQAVPFVVIVVVLCVAGGRLPSRGSLGEVRLPPVVIPSLRLRTVIPTVLLGLAALVFTSQGYRFGVITSLDLAVLALSFVVVTGYLGQISLAQIAFAGTAGFVLSKYTVSLGVPFPVSIVAAAATAAAFGVVVGLPALRIRGAQLAVVTLAAAVAMQYFVFNNPSLTPLQGNRIPSASLFGWNLAVVEGRDVARLQFGLVVLAIVIITFVLTALLLRGETGRAFLAIRSNERAAASAGINVAKMKLIGFALAAFLAGISGALIGYSRGQLSGASFTVFVGLTALAGAYLGGIGRLSGALVAGAIGPLGIVYVVMSQDLGLGVYFSLISAVALVVAAVQNPVGIVGGFVLMHEKMGQAWAARSGSLRSGSTAEVTLATVENADGNDE